MYYNYNKEPTKPCSNYQGPYIMETWPTLYNLEAGLGEINVFCPRLVRRCVEEDEKAWKGLTPTENEDKDLQCNS